MFVSTKKKKKKKSHSQCYLDAKSVAETLPNPRPPCLVPTPPPPGGERSLGPKSIENTRCQRKFLQGAEADLHCDTMVLWCNTPPPPQEHLIGTAEHCCICIPGRACVERSLTCVRPPGGEPSLHDHPPPPPSPRLEVLANKTRPRLGTSANTSACPYLRQCWTLC